MKNIIFLLAIANFLTSCATNNENIEVQVDDNDKIAVCGEVEGEKQTYPTLGDLKNDGAKFLFYGPCYE